MVGLARLGARSQGGWVTVGVSRGGESGEARGASEGSEEGMFGWIEGL